MLILKQTLTFDSDINQWYKHMCVCVWGGVCVWVCVGACVHACMRACVCVCAYTLQVIIFNILWLCLLFVFLSIKSISFDVKSDDFCILKIWIHQLLLINIKPRSVQQSNFSPHELPYEFLKILSIFRGNFYCLNLATVAVDINVKTLKGNGILLSQFAQNVML